jgi:hypothetical protein
MTLWRLFGIATIFLCSTIGWIVLGATVVDRTDDLDARLGGEVEKLWGGHHVQQAPTAWYEVTRKATREVSEPDATGKPVSRTITEDVIDRVAVPLTRTRIGVDLALDYRRKGLLWYDTYAIDFAARYELANPTTEPRTVHVQFAFPSRDAIYDGFRFVVDGRPAAAAKDLSGVSTTVELAPAAKAGIEVGYRSRGLDAWKYSFGDGVSQVDDFELVARTGDADIDYPAGSMSPTQQADGASTWRFASLVAGHHIGVDLPARTNPGPLAARIAFFAPVGLLFFFTVMVILGLLRGRSLHPMNYFFLSAGFFAFHLLFAYLVDHVDVHAAFGIATVISVALVVSYLRLAAGRMFVVVEAAIAQTVFLVLFSYAFFFEGYTGLTVTAGAVITLFVLMQVTGRVDWASVFQRRAPAAPPMPPMPPSMPTPPMAPMAPMPPAGAQ